MAGKVNPIPEAYSRITPYLIIRGAAQAIEFYKKVFGAVEIMRISQPDGRVGHAELKIRDSKLMLADEFPEKKILGPASIGDTPVSFNLYVEDVDAAAKQALAAGAKELRPIQDQFYGDRSGSYQDPFGHVWHLSTHIEDVSPEEMKKRAAGHAKG